MVNHDMQLKFQLSPLREQRTILLMLGFIDEQWLLTCYGVNKYIRSTLS